MADLEDTVLSLRRVLNEKEREVAEYEAKTRSLETDLSRARTHETQALAGPRLESREEVRHDTVHCLGKIGSNTTCV